MKQICFLKLILIGICLLTACPNPPFNNPVDPSYAGSITTTSVTTTSVTPTSVTTRFADNGDGTATDSETGLMWTKSDNDYGINWNDSEGYCRNLNLGGHRDWRMGTIDELEELYLVERDDPCCGNTCHIYYPFNLSCTWVWSSTKGGSSSAWHFIFYDGTRHSHSIDASRVFRVLCVRRSGG